MVCGARLEGELRPDARRPVTILFNDMAGFTGLAERLEPETLRRIMSKYFDVVSEVCKRHGGTVEKFIGDASMAVFGMPTALEDHALRAVRAAVELREELVRLNLELQREWAIRITTRTGLNSGEVVAGDPASGQALVTGDAVNVAARLEQCAAPGEILVGDETQRLVAGAAELERLDGLKVKGKAEPLTAWRLVAVTSMAGQLARRLDAPMLGRDRELQSLCDVFEQVVRNRSARRATILGPAGIGKSRLAHELKEFVGDRGTVLAGTCLPYGEGITFWPLAEIVRQFAGDEPRASIVSLLTGDPHAELIAERVMEAVGLAEASGDGRDVTWAMRKFLEALARERPVVLVLDDLHWAEQPLLDLVESLTEWTRDAPLMLLCLARDDLLEQRPDWGRAEEGTSSITLEPLSEGDTEKMMATLLPESVPASVTATIVERSEGNPLFVEQILALLREEGGAGEEILIPPTIHALLAARLDRLSVAELRAIGAAAVVGREFWRSAISALAVPATRDEIDDGTPPDLEEAIEALVRKDLIQHGSTTLAEEDAFSFRHGLIRDAAYEAQTKRDRAELHERFADWLERRYPQRLVEFEAILGYHLESAYHYRSELAPIDDHGRLLAERAAGRLASAGRRAARAREDAAAVSLLSRASSLYPASALERLELLPIIGESLEGTANHTKAAKIYSEALEAAAAGGHRAVEGRARLGRTHAKFVADPAVSLDEIVREAERAIAVLEGTGDERSLAEAWRLVGDARSYQGRAADGLAALEQALGHLNPDAFPRSWNAVLFATGTCLLDGPKPLDLAVGFAEKHLELARAKGLRSLEADMLHVLGAAEGRRGRAESARVALTSSTAISEELGLTYMAEWSKRSLGRLELWCGNLPAAENLLRSSYDVLSEMGLEASLGEAAIPLADVLYREGRYQEATRFIESVKDDWASGDVSVEAPRLAVRAKLFANQGWDKHAERTSLRALRLIRRTDWACLQVDALLAHAEVLGLANRADEVIPILEEALPIARSKGYAIAALQTERRLEELGREPAERVS
jgi:class 3 adenylate cyclase/tetratricopeptide (TPR) repeat protein